MSTVRAKYDDETRDRVVARLDTLLEASRDEATTDLIADIKRKVIERRCSIHRRDPNDEGDKKWITIGNGIEYQVSKLRKPIPKDW